MKFLILLVLLNIFTQKISSQEYTFFLQDLNISQYQNKQFKLSASVRKEISNGNEKTFFLVKQYIDINDDHDELNLRAFSEGEEAINETWKTFRVEGKVDKNAKKMEIGFLSINNGKFFYDDFKLEIQNENGKWMEILLKNPGFENSTQNNEPIWGYQKITHSKNFTASITNDNPYSGRSCLMVEGANIYGQNDLNGGFIETNGVKLYYEIYGNGEPLLLLHGAGQSISAFTDQIDYFSSHYKVIALDSRGRGRSSDNDAELTYINQVKDVKGFLDILQIDSVDIVGWSDGGIIGLMLAINYPEKVNKLVAMGANINPEGLFPERLQYHKGNLAELETKNNLEDKFYIKLLKALINYPQLKFEDLNNISAPTLIMAGDHDLIQDTHTVKIFQSIPNSNLAILPGETHWLPESNSKLFNSIVFDFLKKEFEKPKRY